MKYRIKRFSTSGKIWAGIKSGTKGSITGAKWGAILAPGNLIALGTGHTKTALGITAAGAAVGAGIGGYFGFKDGINKYKYNNDPQYREKIEQENHKRWKDSIKYNKEQDIIFSKDFKYKDWENFSKELKEKYNIILPKEILNYIKLYETYICKYIVRWYDSMNNSGDWYSIPEFKEFFPIPISSNDSKMIFNNDNESITLFTVNDAGDDGYVLFDITNKFYGFDLPNQNKSLKKLLIDYIQKNEKDYDLSNEQKNIIRDIKNKINTI